MLRNQQILSIMKAHICIDEITHEDLVNILSGAFYEVFGVYKLRKWESLYVGETIEDKLAHCLLEGGEIGITDYYAEGESYNDAIMAIECDNGDVCYHIGLDDFFKGIEIAFEGEDYQQKWVMDLMNAPENFDASAAFGLMQLIVFHEEIYG